MDSSNLLCDKCGVPIHLHGSACGWLYAMYVHIPTDPDESLWAEKWRGAHPGVIPEPVSKEYTTVPIAFPLYMNSEGKALAMEQLKNLASDHMLLGMFDHCDPLEPRWQSQLMMLSDIAIIAINPREEGENIVVDVKPVPVSQSGATLKQLMDAKVGLIYNLAGYVTHEPDGRVTSLSVTGFKISLAEKPDVLEKFWAEIPVSPMSTENGH